MTTLLDAYALVALLAEEPAAEDVEQLLRKGDCWVVVFNLAEAIDISSRVHGLRDDEVRQAVEPLVLGGSLSILTSADREAWAAANLRGKHYEKRSRALSLADCFLLAHALDHAWSIATADPPLAQAARAEGVEIFPLPDSSGNRP